MLFKVGLITLFALHAGLGQTCQADEQGLVGGLESGVRNYFSSLKTPLSYSGHANLWLGWETYPWVFGIEFRAGMDNSMPALDDMNAYNSTGGLGPFVERIWGTQRFRAWARTGISIEAVDHDFGTNNVYEARGIALNVKAGLRYRIFGLTWLTAGVGISQNWLSTFANLTTPQALSVDAIGGIAFGFNSEEKPKTEAPSSSTENESSRSAPTASFSYNRPHFTGEFGFDLNTQYFSSLQQKVNNLDAPQKATLDLGLGIYFALPNAHMLLGIASTMHGDLFNDSAHSFDSNFSMVEIKLGPSVKYYFGSNPTSGVFVRGDLDISYFSTGNAYALNNIGSPTYQGVSGVDITTLGPGAIIGVGYSVVTSRGVLGLISITPALKYEVAAYSQGQIRRYYIDLGLQI